MSAPPIRVEEGDVRALVDPARNAAELAYLDAHTPSCHSDLGEAVIAAARPCGDWVAFSPSFAQCRYLALVTNRTIFALGLGQRAACFRVPAALHVTALATGATDAPEIGPEWVRFELFRPDWPAPDLLFWARKAYSAARGNL